MNFALYTLEKAALSQPHTIYNKTIHGVFVFVLFFFYFAFVCFVLLLIGPNCRNDAFARASFLTTATKLPETSVRRGKWKENEPRCRCLGSLSKLFRYFASSRSTVRIHESALPSLSHTRALRLSGSASTSNHHFLWSSLCVCFCCYFYFGGVSGRRMLREQSIITARETERERKRHCQKLVFAFGQIGVQNINIYVSCGITN